MDPAPQLRARPPLCGENVLRDMFLKTCVLGLLIGPRVVGAHQVGLSRGVYTVEGAAVVAEVTFARGELGGLLSGPGGDGALVLDEAAVTAGVVAAIEVGDGAVGCVGALVRAGLTEEDGAVVVARYACPRPLRTLTLRMPLLGRLGAGHRHLAQVVRPGAEDSEFVVRADSAAQTIEIGAPARRPVLAYFELGVEHILIGVDHLVFLFGLVLVGGRLRSLVAVVTAFTVGHSLSLALATLGVWTPGAGLVEPAIALSVAYVGVENFFVADARGRWRIGLPFGFVHGFGFAGVLAEIGLPANAAVPALALFNLGVEAGQLMVLALVVPALLWLGRQPGYRRIGAARWLSAAIVAAGLYWFVERVIAGA